MANNDNIIYARFNHGHEITTDPRSQYAYGQVVKISGLHLPASFDADIANKGDKQAKATIGINNELPIDDNYFLSGKDIIVMINVHATDKDGRTKYIINIPIEKRSKRADIELEPVEQDVVSTAIATLNEAVERTSADVESAENSANRAHESATSAEQSATNASNSETLVKQFTERAETAAESSEKSETNAKASEESAKQSESHAEQIANDIEQFTERAETASRNAESSATTAIEKADEISESADIATAKANEASNAATYAGEFANSASASANKAELNAQKTQSDKEVVELAKTDVMSAVDSAQNYAESAQSANQAIQDMNVQAVTLDVGSDVTVEKTVDPATGAVTLTYGIPKGVKGDKGDTGEQGIQGIQGEKGEKGDQGIQGIQGEKGEQGIQGIQGERGEKGEKGDQGEQGIQGERGLTGANGFSPTVSTSEITGGHQVVITDTNGEHSFLVMNGEKGEKGDPATGMEIHICGSSEYDAETRIPTIANPNDKTFYLVPTEDGTSPDLFTEWVYVNNAWEMFGSASVDLSGYLTDVKINGNSVVTDGVANIPKANSSTYGVVKVNGNYGIGKMGDGSLTLMLASERESKDGTNMHNIIAPINQHISTFYGLAKASGDTTQSQSDNPVGTYTDEAKASIKNMLGVEDVDIDSKAPVITETISGDIVSFDDGANDMPLQSLVVDINPVQDLHGYDSPWVGGEGKNLADYDAIYHGSYDTTSLELNPVSEQYRTIIIDNLDAGTYTFSTDLTDCFVLRYAENGVNHGVSTAYTAFTFTVSAKSRLLFCFRKSDSSVITEAFKVQIEKGSTATDWTPYENICPISGFIGCEVHRTGKNLLDPSLLKDQVAWNIIPIYAPVGTVLTMSTNQTNNVTSGLLTYFRIPGGAQGSAENVLDTHSVTKTVGEEGYLEVVQRNRDNIKSYADYEYQIELGSTATDYEPYQGNTYPITFPSEAGTVYGAYVDVLNGELVVDRAMVVFDGSSDEQWTYYAVTQGNLFRLQNYSTMKPTADIIPAISNAFKAVLQANRTNGTISSGIGGTNVDFIFDRANSLTEWMEWLAENNIQLCYELATPIHYPLTSTQINSLYGQNNLWANTGDTEVEYRASTKMYIDRKITEAVASALNS